MATNVTFNKQDGLITITPLDGQGGPTSIDPSTLKAVSSVPAAFADGVLDPPDQTQPGRVAYTMRCLCFSRAVGDTAAFHVTAKGAGGSEITGPDVGFEVVEAGQQPPVGGATVLDITGSAVPKV